MRENSFLAREFANEKRNSIDIEYDISLQGILFRRHFRKSTGANARENRWKIAEKFEELVLLILLNECHVTSIEYIDETFSSFS